MGGRWQKVLFKDSNTSNFDEIWTSVLDPKQGMSELLVVICSRNIKSRPTRDLKKCSFALFLFKKSFNDWEKKKLF